MRWCSIGLAALLAGCSGVSNTQADAATPLPQDAGAPVVFDGATSLDASTDVALDAGQAVGLDAMSARDASMEVQDASSLSDAGPYSAGWDFRLGANALNDIASTVTVDGAGQVLIGGPFTKVAGKPANMLARFDPVSGTLSPVPNSLTGSMQPAITAIASFEGKLTVGGSFAGGLASQLLSDLVVLGGGLKDPGYVYALAPDGPSLWVGGAFFTSDGLATNLCQWTATGWESPVPDPGAVIVDIARDGKYLWVVGDFISLVNVPNVEVRGVARYDFTNQQWSNTGVLALEGGGINNRAMVFAVVVTPEFVYLGGDFTKLGELDVRALARWRRSTQAWEALPPVGSPPMANAIVQALAYDQGKLYVGGMFSKAAGLNAGNVAVFDTATEGWSTLGTGVSGQIWSQDFTQVLGIAASGKDVYLAGEFAFAGGLPSAGFAHYRQP